MSDFKTKKSDTGKNIQESSKKKEPTILLWLILLTLLLIKE